MPAEFRSFSEILRTPAVPVPADVPSISPLIAEPPAPCEREGRLRAARCEQRFEVALERLLHEIATEVLGRELALAPLDVTTIVERLLQRSGVGNAIAVLENHGDIDLTISEDGGRIDASLGRRLRAAIDRAVQ